MAIESAAQMTFAAKAVDQTGIIFALAEFYGCEKVKTPFYLQYARHDFLHGLLACQHIAIWTIYIAQ